LLRLETKAVEDHRSPQRWRFFHAPALRTSRPRPQKDRQHLLPLLPTELEKSPTACRVIAKCRHDVCGLPECARPRAQQRDQASRNQIEQSAQQLGHCSGRGRPHSAVIALGGVGVAAPRHSAAI